MGTRCNGPHVTVLTPGATTSCDIGFVGSTEIALINTVHPADCLEIAAFCCALLVKSVLFSLRGLLNSDRACDSWYATRRNRSILISMLRN